MTACYKRYQDEKAHVLRPMKRFNRGFLCIEGIAVFFAGVLFSFVIVPQSVVAVEAIDSYDSSLGGAQARPGYVYSFPRDHGSHNQYGLEWWYFTGHLASEAGREFGYELTFFRKVIDNSQVQNSASRWAIKHIYFAHFALTDVESQTFRFAEKLSRAGLGKAGAHAEQMRVWIDRWTISPVRPDHQVLELQASDGDIGVDLRLALEKPPIIHGEEGISRKGVDVGQASHYYSLTRLGTKGLLSIQEKTIEVVGLSWMDHEFGSGKLGDDQVGWDWFSIQFGSNMELMVYLLRKKDGSIDKVSSGTLIFPDGRSRHLRLQDMKVDTQDFWTSTKTQTRYPAKWVLEVPSVQLRVTVQPVLSDQELQTSRSTNVAYWEGAVNVSGQHGDMPIFGQGYVELTGYSRPLKMNGENP